MSSATSIPDDTNRAVKRKIESDSQLSLNSTFTMGSDAALPSVEKEAGPAVNAAMVLKGGEYLCRACLEIMWLFTDSVGSTTNKRFFNYYHCSGVVFSCS